MSIIISISLQTGLIIIVHYAIFLCVQKIMKCYNLLLNQKKYFIIIEDRITEQLGSARTLQDRYESKPYPKF